MKLSEVLKKPIQNLSTSTKDNTNTYWDFDFPQRKKVTKLPVIGLPGGQATAHEHTPSGRVVKVAYLYTGEQDPAYQFLRVCLKHQDNPHFPKIYNVKQYPTDDADTIKVIMTMERLYPMDWSDVGKILEIVGMDIKEWGKFDREYLSSHIQKMSQSTVTRHKIYKMTTDRTLKQAMKLLEPLFRNYTADMHFGNIMIRKSNNGPQLVFMDPVTYG